MIRRIRHKGLERFYRHDDTRGIDADHVAKLRRQLSALNTATGPENMNLGSWKLHPLKGDLRGFWAVTVNKNWRLIFAFEGEDATDLDLIDYH